MFNIWTIARREYKLYFATPLAYVIMFLVLLSVGAYFALHLTFAVSSNGQYAPGADVVTSITVFILVFACPAVTMRLISEEQRMGTLELLMTAPVRDYEVVVGKWLGSLLFMLTIIGITLIYPIALHFWLVEPGIDQGPLLTGYLGMILVTATFLSIGTAASSIFSNQIAAFFVSFLFLLFTWWIFGIFAQVPAVGNSALFRYLSFSGHFYDSLAVGVIALGDLVYLLSITALGLFVASMAVEMRRWR